MNQSRSSYGQTILVRVKNITFHLLFHFDIYPNSISHKNEGQKNSPKIYKALTYTTFLKLWNTESTGCKIWHLVLKDCAPIFKYIAKRQVDKMNEKIGTWKCASEHNLNLMLIFVLCRVVLRTGNRAESADETNACFAKMRLQFKIIGTLKLASVNDGHGHTHEPLYLYEAL